MEGVRKIRFTYVPMPGVCDGKRTTVYVEDGEAPNEALASEVMQSVEIQVGRYGGTVVSLAMLLSPEHRRWREQGIEDAKEFLAGLMQEVKDSEGGAVAADALVAIAAEGEDDEEDDG